MGFLDRFRTPEQPNDPEPVELEPWDGADVDWAAAGVPTDRVAMAAEVATSPDFGVDPSPEPGFRWRLALFDDVRGVVGDDAIEALPAWLMDQPGIEQVDHFDREFMDVRGEVDRDSLAVQVVARLATTGDPHYWDDDIIEP